MTDTRKPILTAPFCFCRHQLTISFDTDTILVHGKSASFIGAVLYSYGTSSVFLCVKSMKATKLPSGNYRCRVEIGRDASGKRIWKSITGPNKKAVEAEAAQFALTHTTVSDKGSFKHAADAYIASRRAVLSPSTIRDYISRSKYLEQYCPWLYNMQIYAISTQDLQRVVDTLVEQGFTPKTVKNYYGFLSVVLDTAGVSVRSPRMPQRERPMLNVPDEETVRLILDAAKGTELEIPILLAAFGPLRRGEICALSLDDIKDNVVHVRHAMVRSPEGEWIVKAPKTYTSDRYIAMPENVIAKIRERGYVTAMNPNQLSSAFKRFLQRLDIEPFRFHDLRHFCCSYLHGLNVPDIYIMQRSGHATTYTLRQIYTHTLQNQSEAETRKILSSFDTITG